MIKKRFASKKVIKTDLVDIEKQCLADILQTLMLAKKCQGVRKKGKNIRDLLFLTLIIELSNSYVTCKWGDCFHQTASRQLFQKMHQSAFYLYLACLLHLSETPLQRILLYAEMLSQCLSGEGNPQMSALLLLLFFFKITFHLLTYTH